MADLNADDRCVSVRRMAVEFAAAIEQTRRLAAEITDAVEGLREHTSGGGASHEPER